MFKMNSLHQIDEVVDAIVLDGGAMKLVDEAQLAIHVFPKDELDITTICEDAIKLYTDSNGQDIFTSTFHTDDACVHVFFVGRSDQVVDRLTTLHLRVLAAQHMDDKEKS